MANQTICLGCYGTRITPAFISQMLAAMLKAANSLPKNSKRAGKSTQGRKTKDQDQNVNEAAMIVNNDI